MIAVFTLFAAVTVVANNPATGPQSPAAEPQTVVGREAPEFTLSRLSEGEVSLSLLRGRVVVLVVSSSMASASGSRDWMMELGQSLQGRAVELFNIALVQEPWWMPRSLARSHMRELVPEHGHARVLVEWGRSFLEHYRISWNREPYVIVIDAAGVVRHLRAGTVGKTPLADVLSVVASLQGG